MVKGLEVFREHFRDYADRYVLIGGAACDIAMNAAGLGFRATKDLDIVLYVEALDAAFVQAFWGFVRAGGYEVQEKSTGPATPNAVKNNIREFTRRYPGRDRQRVPSRRERITEGGLPDHVS
jgi:glutathionyl-hydroquinone reductase